jgi:hypothetical protein
MGTGGTGNNNDVHGRHLMKAMAYSYNHTLLGRVVQFYMTMLP